MFPVKLMLFDARLSSRSVQKWCQSGLSGTLTSQKKKKRWNKIYPDSWDLHRCLKRYSFYCPVWQRQLQFETSIQMLLQVIIFSADRTFIASFVLLFSTLKSQYIVYRYCTHSSRNFLLYSVTVEIIPFQMNYWILIL